jgi:hypothetical protein
MGFDAGEYEKFSGKFGRSTKAANASHPWPTTSYNPICPCKQGTSTQRRRGFCGNKGIGQ